MAFSQQNKNFKPILKATPNNTIHLMNLLDTMDWVCYFPSRLFVYKFHSTCSIYIFSFICWVHALTLKALHSFTSKRRSEKRQFWNVPKKINIQPTHLNGMSLLFVHFAAMLRQLRVKNNLLQICCTTKFQYSTSRQC